MPEGPEEKSVAKNQGVTMRITLMLRTVYIGMNANHNGDEAE